MRYILYLLYTYFRLFTVKNFKACKQYIKDVQWLKETDVETLDLKKTDFIVFEDFTGKDFDKLLNGKCA